MMWRGRLLGYFLECMAGFLLAMLIVYVLTVSSDAVEFVYQKY